MNWHTWMFYVTTDLVICLTPGPAVLFVVSYALSRGWRASLFANAGILAANAFYFILSAVGLGAILLLSYRVFTVTKYAGGLYLVYLGIQTIRGAGVGLQSDAAGQAAGGHWRAFARASMVQIANPKAFIFFIAFLPQFIDLHYAVWPQVAILGVTSLVIECAVLAGYGSLASRAAELARQPRFVTATNRLSGSMLMLAGAGVAFASER